MKRYAVSRVIGEGTDELTMFRPALSSVTGLSWGVVIAPDHVQNPNKRWVLCVVAGTQAMIDAVNAQADSAVLDFGPDQNNDPWVSIGNQQYRQSLVSAVKSRTGYNLVRDDPRNVLDVINDLGRDLDPTFNAENMRITDNYA